HVALREALLIPLAKRLHDLVPPVAVPFARLSRVPHHITVEDFLDRTEVALTPSCQALSGDLGRVAVHITRLLRLSLGWLQGDRAARCGWNRMAGLPHAD